MQGVCLACIVQSPVHWYFISKFFAEAEIKEHFEMTFENYLDLFISIFYTITYLEPIPYPPAPQEA